MSDAASYPTAVTTTGARPTKAGLGWLVASCALVLGRGLAYVVWPQIDLDGDQAVTGLMAKHLVEGRAFPVFQYGQSYVLVIEAWLTALVFLATGVSAAALKVVPVLLNVALVALAFTALTRDVSLEPRLAFVALLPLSLASPTATAELTAAMGMTVEPLLFSLLIWHVRRHPALLGVTVAVGLMTREFTIYAVTALLLVDRGPWNRPIDWTNRGLSLAAAALTWALVGVVRTWGSPLGPGTVDDGGGGHLGTVASFVCVDPQQLPTDLALVSTSLLPALYGLSPGGGSWLWPVVVWPVVALTLGGPALGALWRERRARAGDRAALPLFLLLIGVQAFLVYATTRCGSISLANVRYLLPALLAPVGAGALVLACARRAGLRHTAAAALVVWAVVNAGSHISLLRSYTTTPPVTEHVQLARHLDRSGARYILTDYWTGYLLAFLTGERIRPLTEFQRVQEYTLAVEAHRREALVVRRVHEGSCEGGHRVAGWYVCPPGTPAGE